MASLGHNELIPNDIQPCVDRVTILGMWQTNQQTDNKKSQNPCQLNPLRPGYSRRTVSTPLLLMPWLFESPGHQQPWHWLCSIKWVLALWVTRSSAAMALTMQYYMGPGSLSHQAISSHGIDYAVLNVSWLFESPGHQQPWHWLCSIKCVLALWVTRPSAAMALTMQYWMGPGSLSHQAISSHGIVYAVSNGSWLFESPGHQQPWHWLCSIEWVLALWVTRPSAAMALTMQY